MDDYGPPPVPDRPSSRPQTSPQRTPAPPPRPSQKPSQGRNNSPGHSHRTTQDKNNSAWPFGEPDTKLPVVKEVVTPAGDEPGGGLINADGASGAFARWCDNELGGEAVNLDHAWPEDFVTCQWPVPARWYLIYRCVVAVVLLVWVSGDMAFETERFYGGHLWRWFIFATNWSFLVLAVSAVYQAVTCVIFEYRPYWILDPIHIRQMTTVLRFQWLLFNISCCSALVVTVGYWGYVAFVSNSHEFIILTPDGPQKVLLTSSMSRLKHSVNSVLILLDIAVNATPVRLHHMFISIFTASLYVVFNGLYYVAFGSLVVETTSSPKSFVDIDIGSRRGYYFMNWASPVEAICTCVLGMMLVVLAQTFLHILFLVRRWLYQRYIYNRSQGDSEELQNIVSRSNTYDSLH